MRSLAVVAVLAGLTSVATAQPTFTPLGHPEGATGSWAYDVSGDGRTVIVTGLWRDADPSDRWQRIWRWSEAEGYGGTLPILPGYRDYTTVRDVSYDGLHVVGFMLRLPGTPGSGFALWSPAGVQLAADWTGLPLADPSLISEDGRTVAGIFSEDGESRVHALWSERHGLEPVHPVPYNRALSGDGSRVFGWPVNGDPASLPTTWTRASGGAVLPPGADPDCVLEYRPRFNANSRYGTVAFASLGVSDAEPRLIRWTAERGIECLDVLEPLFARSAWVGVSGVTADGSTVLGYQSGHLLTVGQRVSRSFIWNESSGVTYLGEILAETTGFELSSWQALYPTDISADGRVITGVGEHGDGTWEGWVLHRWPDPGVEVDIGTSPSVRAILTFDPDPIEVAIFGSEKLDVGRIDAERLRLGAGGATPLLDLSFPLVRLLSTRDVDGDGHLDLLVYFSAGAAGVAVEPGFACVTGTVEGTPFDACEDLDPHAAWCGWGFELAVVPVAVVVAARRRRGGALSVARDARADR